MADVITPDVISIVSDAARMAAGIMLKKVAAEYGLNGDDLELKFEDGSFVFKINRADKVTIICGQDMRPTNPKEFGPQLRRALALIADQKMVTCKAIESVNTIKARNDRYQEMYRTMRQKKLLPSSQLVYRKFTTIIVIDEKSGESVMVSGEDVNIWNLQNEAHILISKKVLGE